MAVVTDDTSWIGKRTWKCGRLRVWFSGRVFTVRVKAYPVVNNQPRKCFGHVTLNEWQAEKLLQEIVVFLSSRKPDEELVWPEPDDTASIAAGGSEKRSRGSGLNGPKLLDWLAWPVRTVFRSLV
jgi:hypothetical protein